MKKKIGIVVMSLVLCLALVGVGYAKWSDTVDINGTVETGTVEVGILNVETNDPGLHGTPGDPGSYLTGSMDPYYVPGPCPCFDRYTKNVASVDSKSMRSNMVSNSPICLLNRCLKRQRSMKQGVL